MVDAENRLRDMMTGAGGLRPGPSTRQVQGELNLQRPPEPEFMRLSGVWATAGGVLELRHTSIPGYITGTLTPPRCGSRPIPIILAVDDELRDAEGAWSSAFQAGGYLHKLPVVARLSQDGGTLELRSTGNRPSGVPELLTGVRMNGAASAASRWLGTWDTTHGRMMVRAEGNHLIGTIGGGNLPNGDRVAPRTIAFAEKLFTGGSSGGAWRDESDKQLGLVRWQLAPDGMRFFGSYTRRVGQYDIEEAWAGSRVGQVPALQPAVPDALFSRFSGAWKTQLGTTTIERSGRGATMTVADAGGKTLFTSLLSPSADGRSLEGAASGWLELGHRPFRLSLTPDGADLNAWSVGDAGDAPCSLWSGYSETRRADGAGNGGGLGGSPTPDRPVPSPGPSRPAPSPAPGPVAEVPADGFQSLARWDVRLDRVENPRDDRLTHVYLTLRNAGTATLLQTQDVWVYLEDSGGVEQRSGQGLLPQPGYPKLFGSPPPVVRPGREIRTKFVFDRHEGASPTRITVEEGGKEAAFEF
jgi:hypothetical protein